MDNIPGITSGNKFSKYFILASFFVFFMIFLGIIRPFFMQIIIAAVIATLFRPFFLFMLKLCKMNRSLASLLCCILILLSVLLPFLVLSKVVITQGLELMQGSDIQIATLAEKINTSLLGKYMNSSLGQWLASKNIVLDWHKILTGSLNFLGVSAAQFVNQLSRKTIVVLFDIFVTLFSLFYFFRDGEVILSKIKLLIPISDDYKERIVSTFSSMANAVVKGVVYIGFLQAALATVTLWAFGIKTWLLWGVVMLFTSVIPFVGTSPILIPAGLIKIMYGDIWQGIAIIIISVLFISSVDNILRPRVVGYHSDMHDLLVFFSMIGGIFLFGPMGIIIGPLFAAVFLTIIEIYSIEFKKHIETN